MFCKSLVFLSELGCIFGKKSCKNLVKVLYFDMEKNVATLTVKNGEKWFLKPNSASSDWILTKLGMRDHKVTATNCP